MGRGGRRVARVSGRRGGGAAGFGQYRDFDGKDRKARLSACTVPIDPNKTSSTEKYSDHSRCIQIYLDQCSSLSMYLTDIGISTVI